MDMEKFKFVETLKNKLTPQKKSKKQTTVNINDKNLQLLDGTKNKEKNDADFEQWLHDNYSDTGKLNAYMERNYIPDVSLQLNNFEEFFEEREKLLFEALKKALM